MMSINQIMDLVQRVNTSPDQARPAAAGTGGNDMHYDEDGAVMRAIAEAARLYQEKTQKGVKPDEIA